MDLCQSLFVGVTRQPAATSQLRYLHATSCHAKVEAEKSAASKTKDAGFVQAIPPQVATTKVAFKIIQGHQREPNHKQPQTDSVAVEQWISQAQSTT